MMFSFERDDVELTDREKMLLIAMAENQMDGAALMNDDEGVKEIATIIRKLGGGQ